MTDRELSRNCVTMPRPEFERLSVEDAIEVMERYPHLSAVLRGTHSAEWPMLRTELQILLYAVHAHSEEVRQAARSETAPNYKLAAKLVDAFSRLDEMAYAENTTLAGTVPALHKVVIEAMEALKGSASASIRVPRSLAERTEAMFRSVDPAGGIAQEWKEAIK